MNQFHPSEPVRGLFIDHPLPFFPQHRKTSFSTPEVNKILGLSRPPTSRSASIAIATGRIDRDTLPSLSHIERPQSMLSMAMLFAGRMRRNTIPIVRKNRKPKQQNREAITLPGPAAGWWLPERRAIKAVPEINQPRFNPMNRGGDHE